MNTIHFIGGEKGGVGKSVFSRLLSQYFLDHNMHYAGFDADQSHDTLTRFYPEFTQPVNLDKYESADRIIETALENDVNVVVDLPAQSERFLKRWMEDNDVSALCEETGVKCYFWYVVDDGMDSARLAAAFLDRYQDELPCVLVHNYGRGGDFSSLEKTIADAGVTPKAAIAINELHDGTMRKIDKLSLNFWAAGNLTERAEGTLSLMERQRTRVWCKKSYAEIEKGLQAHTSSLAPQII